MTDDEKKWDLKQLGVGGGSVLGLLFLFQGQGIDLMTKNQQASTQVVIEKTMANSARIEMLEKSVDNLNGKIDEGFDSLRKTLKQDISSIDRTIRELMGDRWSKSDHKHYRNEVDSKFRFIERRVDKLESDEDNK